MVVDGTIVEMVSELKILGVILDSKLAFEKPVRAIAASALRRVCILRKTMSVFRDVAVVTKCFWAFKLPVLEYCSPVWMSAATSHLLLLDHVAGQVSRLIKRWKCQLRSLAQAQSGISECLLQNRSLVDHPVRGLYSAQYVLRRLTRAAIAAHSRSFEMPRFITG